MPIRKNKEVVDKHTVLNRLGPNVSAIRYSIAARAEGVTLNTLRIFSGAKQPRFLLNRLKQNNAPALYIISMKRANQGIFKMGMTGSKLLSRLCGYKPSLPLESDIIIHAVLSFPKRSWHDDVSIKLLVGGFVSV